MANNASDARITPARPEDLPEVLALLEAAGLPLVGVPDHFSNFLVARSGDRIEGTVGIELYGPDAILRSLAVVPELRGTGRGRELARSALRLAEGLGARNVYLLTTTAAEFFSRLSFERIDLARVPDSIASSVEFSSGVCPKTSACMRRSLDARTCCRTPAPADDACLARGAADARGRARSARSSRRSWVDHAVLLTHGF